MDLSNKYYMQQCCQTRARASGEYSRIKAEIGREKQFKYSLNAMVKHKDEQIDLLNARKLELSNFLSNVDMVNPFDAIVENRPSWCSRNVFRIFDTSLATYYSPIINKFWDDDRWNKELEKRGLAYCDELNPNVLVFDIGEPNFMTKYYRHVRVDCIPVTNKESLCTFSNKVFMPRKCDLIYYDLPIYAFADGSTTTDQTAPSNKAKLWIHQKKRFGWGCLVLKDLTKAKSFDVEKLTAAWASCENHKAIDIPSSTYSELMGILETINLTCFDEPKIKHGNHMIKKIEDCGCIRKNVTMTADHDIRILARCRSYRTLVICCDNTTAVRNISTTLNDDNPTNANWEYFRDITPSSSSSFSA